MFDGSLHFLYICSLILYTVLMAQVLRCARVYQRGALVMDSVFLLLFGLFFLLSVGLVALCAALHPVDVRLADQGDVQ
jgi:hypothetical protein